MPITAPDLLDLSQDEIAPCLHLGIAYWSEDKVLSFSVQFEESQA